MIGKSFKKLSISIKNNGLCCNKKRAVLCGTALFVLVGLFWFCFGNFYAFGAPARISSLANSSNFSKFALNF